MHYKLPANLTVLLRDNCTNYVHLKYGKNNHGHINTIICDCMAIIQRQLTDRSRINCLNTSVHLSKSSDAGFLVFVFNYFHFQFGPLDKFPK